MNSSNDASENFDPLNAGAIGVSAPSLPVIRGQNTLDGPAAISDFVPAPANPPVSANAVIDQSGADLSKAVQAASPQTDQGGFYLLNSIGRGLADAWSHVLGKILILGGIAALTWTLWQHFNKDAGNDPTAVRQVKITTPLTSQQAAQAQAQLNQKLNQSATALVNAGNNAQTVSDTRNFLQLEDGTAIQKAIAPSTNSNTAAATGSTMSAGTIVSPASTAKGSSSMIVTGTSSPSNYSAVSQVDASQYVATLSPTAAPSEISQNSAVVHGMSTSQ